MYVSQISLFMESPFVFEVKPSKPGLNVTSNHETIGDNPPTPRLFRGGGEKSGVDGVSMYDISGG